MAITHPTGVRNGIADHVVDQIDSGTTDAQGDLVIDDGGVTLVTINLQDPAFGNASSGTATMNGSPSGTATATGTADGFVLQDKDNSSIFTGTVGTSTSADLQLSSTSISSGDKVQITSFTYSAPS